MSGTDSRRILSSSHEDYLKQLYSLGQGGKVNTQALADALGVTPASVTGMLKKLLELGLVEHTAYQGARLTPEGERVALEVLRHHRLIEAYLHHALGYPLDEVHDEAERLEHVISETLEARMAEWLGHPSFDPHGDPIPSLDLLLPSRHERSLATLPVGAHARIVRVPGDTALLRALLDRGLTPGIDVTVIARDDGLGTVTLKADQQVVLSSAVAAQVRVTDEVTA